MTTLRHIATAALVTAVMACAPTTAHAGLSDLYFSLGIPPTGANDFSCRSKQHPSPVILVHGTFGSMTYWWNTMAVALEAKHYCVFALDLPRRGTVPIEQSADKLSEFIYQVRRETHSAKVSLVGHSQGGVVARYAALFRGDLDHIDKIVGVAPPNHGTTSAAARWAGDWLDCPACHQLVAGSPFLQTLNSASEEAPGPTFYTVIASRNDRTVIPYESQFLEGENVTNVVLQDSCPDSNPPHLGMIWDPLAIKWTLHALRSEGRTDPEFRPRC